MATAQAFCNICQRKVSANTILTDDDLRRALDRDEDIRVMHVFVDEDASSADHMWSLTIEEKGEPPQVPELGTGLVHYNVPVWTHSGPNRPNSAI